MMVAAKGNGIDHAESPRQAFPHGEDDEVDSSVVTALLALGANPRPCARGNPDDAPSPSEVQLRNRCSNPLTATPADLTALQNLLQNKTAASQAVRTAQVALDAFVESFNAAEAGAAEFKRLTALRAALDTAMRAAGAAQALDKREGEPRDALLDMPTTEFNRYLKLSHLTPNEIQDLRKERRRKKNRLYAKRSRGKKLQRTLDEETHGASATSPTPRVEIPELHSASSSANTVASSSANIGARAHAAQRPTSLSPVAVA